MPISETLHIVNLTPVILKTFWSIYSRWEWTGNLILGGTESFAGTSVMPFQVRIGSLGGTLFFQVGLCAPLRTIYPYCLYCMVAEHLSVFWNAFVPALTGKSQLLYYVSRAWNSFSNFLGLLTRNWFPQIFWIKLSFSIYRIDC